MAPSGSGTPEEMAARFQAALDLAETGIAIMRENLRRRHPDATPAEVEDELWAWLLRRPPDSPGRPRTVISQ